MSRQPWSISTFSRNLHSSTISGRFRWSNTSLSRKEKSPVFEWSCQTVCPDSEHYVGCAIVPRGYKPMY